MQDLDPPGPGLKATVVDSPSLHTLLHSCAVVGNLSGSSSGLGDCLCAVFIFFSQGTPISFDSILRFTGVYKLPVGVNLSMCDCLSLCVCLVKDWQPIQSVPCLLSIFSWDLLQQTQNWIKWYRRWMEIITPTTINGRCHVELHFNML